MHRMLLESTEEPSERQMKIRHMRAQIRAIEEEAIMRTSPYSRNSRTEAEQLYQDYEKTWHDSNYNSRRMR